MKNEKGGEYTVTLAGAPFNDAYRYADWLLTVPLLLVELILVMRLPAEQTKRLSWSLGLASALMVPSATLARFKTTCSCVGSGGPWPWSSSASSSSS